MNSRDLAELVSQHTERNGRKIPATFIYAQMAHETGGFKSELALKHNNFGGVTQVTPNGLDQPDGSNYYMNFGSPDEFAEYYGNYLSKYAEDGIYEATTIDQYANALKRGGYYGDTVENYAAGMKHFAGQDSILELSSYAKESVDPQKPIVEQDVVADATFMDKLYDAMDDSVIWGAVRTAGLLKDAPNDDAFTLTQEDIDAVQKELGGDYSATLWVAQNAKSYTQLTRLTQLKKADLERRKRIDVSPIGLNTTGTIIGGLLDPLNYIPFLGAVGKVGTVARYAKLAASGGAFNLVERGFTQATTGYSQNYPMAVLMGAVAGAGLPFAADMIGKSFSRKTKATGEQLMGDMLNMEHHAEALKVGKKSPNAFQNLQDFVDTLTEAHDTAFVRTIKDDIAEQLHPKNGVYLLAEADARRIVRKRGIELADKVKGIFDDETGTTILIKENLGGVEDIRKTLLHEKGAHGLKYILSPQQYKSVLADLKFRINNNPSPAIKRAVRRAGGSGDVEEVLGYLAEELTPANPLMKKLKKQMDKAMNAMGLKGRMTDEEFVDILTRSSKQHIENQQGYRVLKDGSVEFQGFHYSKKNFLNPQHIDNAVKTLGLGKSLTDWFKRAKLFATPYSVGSTSKSKTMKAWTTRFLENPYMDTEVKEVTAESYKNFIHQRLNTYVLDYMKVRDKHLVRLQKLSAGAKDAYNEQVIRAYNAMRAGNIAGFSTDNLDDGIKEGVQALQRFREFQEDITRDPSKYLGEGYGLLSKDWQNYDDEVYRFMDDSKHADFINNCGGIKKAKDLLYQYALKAGKKEVVRKQIEDHLTIQWKAECERINKLNKKGRELLPLPERPKLTDEEFQIEFEKRAYECAAGLADRGDNITTNTANKIANDIGDLENLKYRFPMDTSLEIILPNGNAFSYDNNLRSYDLDTFLPMFNNRLSGELAITTKFPKGAELFHMNSLGFEDNLTGNIQGLRQIIETELNEQVSRRQISKSDAVQDLQSFDFYMKKLRGIPTDEHPKTFLDAVATMLNNYAFARNGGNMVFNQAGEVSGTVAYAASDAIFDLFPSLGRHITDLKHGKGSTQLLDDAIMDTFGEDAQQYVFFNANSTRSKMFRMVGTNSPVDKGLDAVASTVKTSASALSKVTGFAKLNTTMIKSAQKHTLIDLAQWVNGKDFPAYRNPFSDKKLKAIGLVGKQEIENFRDTLKPFMRFNEQGKLKALDIKSLRQNDPDTFMQLYTLVENHVNRCIVMPTIGTTNMLKESHPAWRIFFMFKDFTMRASHSQTIRALSNREADDLLALLYSSVTNLGVVTGLAYLRSLNKPEAERKKYLDQYFTPQALAYTALMRNSMTGSILSPVNDIIEATGYAPVGTVRTTTNRTFATKDKDKIVGSFITQLPAVKGALDISEAVTQPLSHDRFTQRDLSKLMSLAPGQNMLPLVWLRDELIQNSNLPKKKTKK